MPSESRPARRSSARIWLPAAYLLFSAAWITGSDYLLGVLFPRDSRMLVWAGTCTGIAFVVLSALLLYSVLRFTESAQAVPGETVATRSPGAEPAGIAQPLAVLGLAAVLIVTIGYALFQQQLKHALADDEDRMSEIAESRAAQIEAWVGAIRRNLQIVADVPFAPAAVSTLRAAGDPELKRRLLTLLEAIRRSQNMRLVWLLDRDGRPMFGVGEAFRPSERTGDLVRRAVDSRAIAFDDFHHVDGDRDTREVMDFSIPLRDPSRSPSTVDAVIVASVDAADALLPLLPARASAGPAPVLRLVRPTNSGYRALGQHEVEAAPDTALAALGRPGPATQADWTGRSADGRSLLVTRPVRGTSWRVLAELDTTATSDGLRRLWSWATLLALIVLAAAASTLSMTWRAQRRREALELGEARQEIDALRDNFAVANRHVNDVIGLVDADGQLLEVNDRAEDMFGWPVHQLVGRNLSDVLVMDHDDASPAQPLGRIILRGQMLTQAMARRADGSSFPVEVSARHFHSGGEDYVNVVVRDVSARMQAEAQRDEALARLKLHFDSMPIACVILSPELQITDTNPAFLRMFGHRREDLRGLGGVEGLVPLEQRAIMVRALTECRDSRIAINQAWTHTTRDGRTIAVQWNVVPIRDASGAVSGLLATGEDVTASVEAERGIQNQRDLFDLLAQTNKAINAERTRLGLYREVVRLCVERGRFLLAWIGEVQADDRVAVLARFGADRGYLDQVRISRKADVPEGRGPTGTAVREGRHEICNDFQNDPRTRPWHESGRLGGIRSSGSFPLRHRGTVVGALTVYAQTPGFFSDDIVATLDEMTQNISFALDSYAAAAELEVSRNLLQQVIDANESVMYAFDLENRAIFLNLKCARLIGMNRDEIIGKTRYELLPKAVADEHLANDRIVIETEQPLSVEETVEIDGRIGYFLSTKYPLRDADGRVIAVGGSSADVTALRLARARLEETNQNLEALVRERTAEAVAAKDRAEEADRAKTAFLSTISHELRTPLNSILGFTSVLLEGLAGPLNEEQQRQLGIVQDSSRHLLAMVNDLLDISRIEAGRLVTESRPFDLGALLNRVHDRFEVMARERALHFTLEKPDALPQMVSDARRVEQILVNLVSNALRYTTIGHVTIRTSVEGGQARISVEDTGPGIAGSDLPRLFKPFSQLANSAGFKEGTGLGLAISLGLARALGGSLTVQSMPGQGSVFSLALPLARPTQ